MTTNPASNLYTALLAAQRAMGPVKKDASNPAFRSKYATLQSVLETIEEPLHANGLVLIQRLQYDRIGRDGSAGEGTPILITELIHAASGEKLDSQIPVVCKDPLDPQKVGGALTYYRRYSLLALLGLAPEDDDGNAASQARSQQQANPARQSRPAAASAHLDTIRDDLADPKARKKALHAYYGEAGTIAALNQAADVVAKSGLPEADLKAAYRFHHTRLSELFAPAGVAG